MSAMTNRMVENASSSPLLRALTPKRWHRAKLHSKGTTAAIRADAPKRTPELEGR